MRQKIVLIGASMFIGASAFGFGNAISDYLYPKTTTVQDLIARVSILTIIFLISWYYQGKASRELDA